VLGGNAREVKCQRRALTSELRYWSAEEAITRTAEAHKWTKAALEQALDDLRGSSCQGRRMRTSSSGVRNRGKSATGWTIATGWRRTSSTSPLMTGLCRTAKSFWRTWRKSSERPSSTGHLFATGCGCEKRECRNANSPLRSRESGDPNPKRP
jgi:hypothetical protein